MFFSKMRGCLLRHHVATSTVVGCCALWIAVMCGLVHGGSRVGARVFLWSGYGVALPFRVRVDLSVAAASPSCALESQ